MGNGESFCCCLGNHKEAGDNEDGVRIIDNDYISDRRSTEQQSQLHRQLDHDDQLSTHTQCEDFSVTSSQITANQLSRVYSDSFESQKIYQQMAKTLIDIAPDDSMIIQPAEAIERQKFYQAKLAELKTPLALKNCRIFRNHQQIENANINSSQQLDRDTSPIKNLGPGPSASSKHQASVPSSTIGTNSTNNQQGCESILNEDVELINNMSLRSVVAVKNIRITSNQQIVSHFRP